MPERDGRSSWAIDAIAGICGLCCVSLTTLAGGAAVTGATVAAVTVASGGETGLRALVGTGLITALPVSIRGLVVWRRDHSQSN